MDERDCQMGTIPPASMFEGVDVTSCSPVPEGISMYLVL